MSRVIQIAKNRITLRKWNGDRRGDHTVKKRGDLWTIINDETKEVVSATPTKDEVEEFFYDETTPPENVWACLRDPIEFVEDVSVRDIMEIVENNEQLLALTGMFLPGFDVYNGLPDETLNEPISLFRKLEVSNGILKIVYDSNRTPCLYPLASLKIDKKVELDCGKGVIASEWDYTLLDLLWHLFGSHSEKAVTLTPQGLFDEEGSQVFAPVHYLLQNCSLDNMSLGDLFAFVEAHEDLKAFIACYSWCRAIDEFHAQAQEPCKERSTLSRLEVYRAGEVHRWVEKKNKTRAHRVSLDLNYDFHGLGPCDEDILEHYAESGSEPPEEQNYSVSYTPVNEMTHLPLLLNTEMEVHEWISDIRENKLHLVCQYPFTLLEVLDAVYWDISFHGGPEDNKAFLEEMKGRMEEVDKAREEGRPIGKSFTSVADMMQDMADTTDDDLSKEHFSEMAEDLREKNADGQDPPNGGVS